MMVAAQRDVLLERGEELGAIADALARAGGGHGCVLGVRGAAGVGKSELVAATCEQAGRAGMRVCRASGSELERDLGFGVVRQLFERPLLQLLPNERAAVMDGAASLAAPIVLDASASSGGGSVQAALHGLYWLTAGLAARGPLLIAIDDAHWADPSSLRWLGYLGRRLEGLQLLVVIAARDSEPGVDQALLERAVDGARVTELRPRELSPEATAVWLKDAFGSSPADMFVGACHAATGGNPLLLRELATSLIAERVGPDAAGAARVGPAAPPSIARWALLRIARLGHGGTAVAEAAAVLSADARLDRLAALASLDIDDVAELADQLVEARILARDTRSFAHPILRAAVYHQIPPARRALAHLRAARLLYDEGAGDERTAAHLLQTAPVGEPWALETLRGAAGAALGRGAPEAAIQLLRRAHAEPRTDPSRVVLELAVAEVAARDSAALSDVDRALTLARDDEARVRAATLAARLLTAEGRFEQALGMVERARRDDADPATRLALDAEELALRGWLGVTPELIKRLRALGVDEMPGTTSPERILLATRAIALVRRAEDPERAVAIARRVLAHEDLAHPDHEMMPIQAARVLAVLDHLDDADRALAAIVAGGRARGAVSAVALGSTMRAEVALRAGRLADAEEHARLALELSIEHDLGTWLPLSAAFVADALIEREPPDAALALIASHGLDGPLGDDYRSQILRYARGRARAAAGDGAGALRDVLAVGEGLLSLGEVTPVTLPWRSTASELLQAVGRSCEARRLADEELELARDAGARRAIGIALRAAALARPAGARLLLLSDAVTALQATPASLELARAHVDLGAALRRAGRRRDAREALRTGLDASARCGARPLAERARQELIAAGARPRRERTSGLDALTASERRVARLAADGLTNRQIAQALFVTTKTVEMHLGRTYPKLGIAGRGDLPIALHDERS
jgi:DNA-binding CsgD family transcriptional regulator